MNKCEKHTNMKIQKCITCNPQYFCQHTKYKYECKLCKGTNLCSCGIRKYTCRIHNLRAFVMNVYRKRLFACFHNGHGYKLLQTIGAEKIEDVIEHIESQFAGEYSWENYGVNAIGLRGWDIDHITPLKAKINGVDPTTEEIIARCHYKNTRPLWYALHKIRPINIIE